MAYPKFENKHLEDALFSADIHEDWRKFSKMGIRKRPSKYVLVYKASLLDRFKRKFKPRKIKIHSILTVYQHKDVGVVRMTGVGSPHAAMILENLIALGGTKFLNIGIAGGLDDFGLYLCERAVRDEGTSYHYLPHGDCVDPDRRLTEQFGKFLREKGQQFVRGVTWTIDAPYRETKAEIRHYKKEGVKTVEMEAAALFAVAKVRKVKIASAFVVSDVLGSDKWDPQFDARHVSQKLFSLFDDAFEFLVSYSDEGRKME